MVAVLVDVAVVCVSSMQYAVCTVTVYLADISIVLNPVAGWP